VTFSHDFMLYDGFVIIYVSVNMSFIEAWPTTVMTSCFPKSAFSLTDYPAKTIFILDLSL
jgi:hypothetical protein